MTCARQDVTKNYNGSSMMVMAFVHDEHARRQEHFKRNWPSPILFDDNFKYDNPDASPKIPLNAGYDNLHVLDTQNFRVFNNALYRGFNQYRRHFPNFLELHLTRKGAGDSATSADTATEALAFQGTMRVKEQGRVVSEVLGSGHHGPDYVGMASIRAGKGYKALTGSMPILQRAI